jgi:hypothetical protein
MPKPDPYEHVVMGEARRALADKIFAVVRADDVQLALDAMGMAFIRILLSAAPKEGKTRTQIAQDWVDHAMRCAKGLDEDGQDC